MKKKKLKTFDRQLRLVLAKLPRHRVGVPDSQPSTILIIKLSAMGDALCMMPAVRMISLAFPAATIDWLTTTRTNPQVFAHLKFIRKVILLPTKQLEIVLFFIKQFSRLRRYDLIVDFDQYYQTSELIARLGKISAGFEAPLKGKTFSITSKYQPELNEKYNFRDLAIHTVNHWLATCPDYEPELPEILSQYKPPKELLESIKLIESAGQPVLVIYPGSSRNAKFRRWGWENYRQIILEFQNRCEVVLAGGPDESDLVHILENLDSNVQNWIGRWSLLDWAWFFQKKQPILLGNDGGLLHIADAIGLPTISVFGPSRFAKWGSVNSRSIAFETEMDCRPCLRSYMGEVPQKCWKGTTECLTQISPVAVMRTVENAIEKLVLVR